MIQTRKELHDADAGIERMLRRAAGQRVSEILHAFLELGLPLRLNGWLAEAGLGDVRRIGLTRSAWVARRPD